MKFAEAASADEPALAVYQAAFAIVFDDDDGNTEHLERLSDEARLVYLLWNLDGEVHNGGFDQFFFNSLGDHWAEILDGLERVGASQSRQLLGQAVRWFPSGRPSADRYERQDQLESFCEQPGYQADVERLNAQYYECEDTLPARLDAFVLANPGASVDR
jgi:hypothetical protein